MGSEIMLKSKGFISKKSLKLFFFSLLSFILRWGVPLSLGASLFFFYKSHLFTFLLKEYNSTLIYSAFGFLVPVLLFWSLVLASGIRLGESFLYFSVSQGSSGRGALLFKFLSSKKAIKGFLLYLKLFFLKIFWLIYFVSPTLICASAIFYLYKSGFKELPVFYILGVGGALLLSISLVMYRCSILRYSASEIYLCLQDSTKINDAINKSIRYTDGFLTEGVILDYRFIGWFISCIFIIPIIYVLPYYKTAKKLYITENIFSKTETKLSYPINLLHLSGEHIN